MLHILLSIFPESAFFYRLHRVVCIQTTLVNAHHCWQPISVPYRHFEHHFDMTQNTKAHTWSASSNSSRIASSCGGDSTSISANSITTANLVATANIVSTCISVNRVWLGQPCPQFIDAHQAGQSNLVCFVRLWFSLTDHAPTSSCADRDSDAITWSSHTDDAIARIHGDLPSWARHIGGLIFSCWWWWRWGFGCRGLGWWRWVFGCRGFALILVLHTRNQPSANIIILWLRLVALWTLKNEINNKSQNKHVAGSYLTSLQILTFWHGGAKVADCACKKPCHKGSWLCMQETMSHKVAAADTRLASPCTCLARTLFCHTSLGVACTRTRRVHQKWWWANSILHIWCNL